MLKTLRSLITALALALAIGVFVVEVVAPYLPPFVGPADALTERALEVPCAPQLIMETGDGSIRVTTYESSENGPCRIHATVRLYQKDRDAVSRSMSDLLASTVAVESSAATIRIRSVPQDWPDDVAALIQYQVEVPEGTNVQLHGVNGNVWVADGCGEVRIESGNADISIHDPRGPVLARSTNGRLRLYGARKPATLETVNGNIDAELLEGRLTAVSVNGRVRADVMRPSVTGAVLRSENGDVEIGLPSKLGFTLDAVAERGRVTGDDVIAGFATGSGAYRGTAGSGDTLLTLHSGNGSIRLSRK